MANSHTVSRETDEEVEKEERALSELATEALLEKLGSRPDGLTYQEAERRLAAGGPNEIAAGRKSPLALRFIANFYHTFALLLWASSALAFLGDLPELGWAIIAVIFINGVFSFWQEFQAEKATEALMKMLPAKAIVIREGRRGEIDARDLVAGDIMVLEEGELISADARLLDAWELQVDNSPLTGEAEPQHRQAVSSRADGLRAAELPNLVFAGTSVSHGSGRAVAFATGMSTEFGRIARLTQSVGQELSPLQKEVNRVAAVIAALAVGLGVALFLIGTTAAGLPLSLAFVFAIGMIVANVPEGLLPTVTLSLAAAVRVMAKKHALVKRLSRVETLGSATVICTDKTGTLTENQMTVTRMWLDGRDLRLTGGGYDPRGELVDAEGDAATLDGFRDLAGLAGKIASLCNNAQLMPPENGRPLWDVLGDPTEGALLVAAAKLGVDRGRAEAESPRLYELPFDSSRKRMTTLHQDQSSHKVLGFVKGSPAELLCLCQRIATANGAERLTDETKERVIAANDDYARSGLRVLGLAYRVVDLPQRHYEESEVESDLIFVGLAAMLDPPRPEVAQAIADAKSAGIRIILITGDYGLTAESIGRQIGLVSGDSLRIVAGNELETMDDAALKEVLGHDQIIFARVAPEQKMRIAAHLQGSEEIVAMTGDGVNDAPALKQADIGIAMGLSGTDVAREASDMVLTDDNFATIVEAIIEGRVVYDNIRKFVTYIFAHLTPEIVPFAAMALTGNAIPLGLTVMQILAIDLGTETLPALALGVEKGEPGVMKRKPLRRRGLVDKELLYRSYIFLGLIEGALVMGAFMWVLLAGGWHYGMEDISRAGSPLHDLYVEATTMTFLAIVGAQIGVVFACRTELASVFSAGLLSNRWVLWGIAFEVAITAILLYVPPIREFFGMAPLGPVHWLVALSFAPVVVLADETRKYVRRRRAEST